MGMKFKKARFHVDYCPQSLIERIYFKMSSVTTVHFNAVHFKDRVNARSIPEFVLHKVENFNIKEWNLVTCEVRTDTGKFVNSTWEMLYGNERYWLTIGFGNVAETIVKKTSSGTGKIVEDMESDLYRFVEDANKKLMDKDRNMEGKYVNDSMS